MIRRDHAEAHIALVDLICAMYPDQTHISPADISALDQYRGWIGSLNEAMPIKASSKILLRVSLFMNGEADRPIELDVSIDLTRDAIPNASASTYTIRQPDWLSKSKVTELSLKLPKDDVIDALNFINNEGLEYIEVSTPETQPPVNYLDPLVRVWFYFPSISTREKRNDIVNYAPTYNLTGFLLAGKPGMLCLEGSSRNVDDYMKFIKTQSWSDIPSHQKKVSERLRETYIPNRVFAEMAEITDAPFMGEKSGERGNRTNMQALEEWLSTKGLRSAFSKIIF